MADSRASSRPARRRLPMLQFRVCGEKGARCFLLCSQKEGGVCLLGVSGGRWAGGGGWSWTQAAPPASPARSRG